MKLMRGDPARAVLSGLKAAQDGTFAHWASRFFPGLEFTARGPHSHYYRHHVHDPLEITWVTSGQAEIACRGRNWQIRRGGAFLVAPGEPHAGGAVSGAQFSFVTLHLPVDLLPAVTACCGIDPGAMPLVAIRSGTRPLLDSLLIRMREAPTGKEQLMALAGMLTDYLAGPGAGISMSGAALTWHPAVNRVRRMLDQAYAGEVPVAELAEAVDLHERYLISLFKTATGIPPHQYQIARRLEHARVMMASPLPLCSVAAETGFTDQSHLTRHFKRTYGITPGAYQRDLELRWAP